MLVWINSGGLLPFVQGFLLCASLIIAVGPQNLFLLRQGLWRHHRFLTAFTCTVVDLLLITARVGGLGGVIAANNDLLFVVTVGSATFLLGYGVRSFRNAWCGCSAVQQKDTLTSAKNWRGTLLAALSFSILNPAAYVDTVLMIGTTSGRYPIDERLLFGVGATVASGLWFFTLTYGSSRLIPLFRHPIAWRTLDGLSGCIMFGIALSLSLPHLLFLHY